MLHKPRFLKNHAKKYVALGLMSLMPLVATAESALVIGSRLELLVDDALIERLEGVSFKLHPPKPAEVSLAFDQPWEGSGNHYLTVLKEDDRYRMYYHSVAGKKASVGGEDWESYVCYAESKDGIAWTRPKLGLYEFHGSKENNIVHPAYSLRPGKGGGWPADGRFPEPNGILHPSVNLRPGAPPEQRYLSLCAHQYFDANADGKTTSHQAGETENNWAFRVYLFASPDGLHWKRLSDDPIVEWSYKPGTAWKGTYYKPTNLSDNAETIFWDESLKKYVVYIRDMRIAPGTGQHIRGVRRATSPDLKQWSYLEWIHLNPLNTDEFYTYGPRPYFRAPHILFSFPMRIVLNRRADFLPAEYDAVRGKGVTDTVFMSSRDGLHWDRRFLESFIRPGLDKLKWTDRSNATSQGLVPTGPQEMSVYVIEYFRLPMSQVRRYTMRTDGIASINAPYAGGELVTKPLIFSGRRLILNAATSAAGGIRVEILDAEGNPIERYTGTNPVEFFGDDTAYEVRWDQGPDVAALAGKPVRLRFLMKDADLFSFRFTE